MTVSELKEKLSLTLYSGAGGIDNEIKGGYASDMLSDVIGNAEEGNIWVTMQSHKNALGVAALKDLSAIVLCNGNKPAEDTMAASNNENIPVLGSKLHAFELISKIYNTING